jgi:hypothetical protein
MASGHLVEFGSVDACAVQMQRPIVDRNAEIAEDQRIKFRIGDQPPNEKKRQKQRANEGL